MSVWATGILLMPIHLALLPAAAWFHFRSIVKSNEYECQFQFQFLFAAAAQNFSIRRIRSNPFYICFFCFSLLLLYFFVFFFFGIQAIRLCLMSPFWKWYSRVKTLIRLALLKGVAGP